MSESTKRRVVVIGGGYVGAPLARALDADYDVTLVDKLPVFFHRMAALRASVDPTATELPFLSRDNLLQNGRIVQAEVVGLHPDEHVIDLSDGSQLVYDAAVIATGNLNQPVAQFTGANVAEAEEHFASLQQQIADAAAVAVIGAGITGVELVGELTSTYPNKPVALFSRGRIVPDLSEKAAAKLLAQLEKRGVKVVSGGVTEDEIPDELAKLGWDPTRTLVLWTTGGTPEAAWLRASNPEWVGPGGIVVDDYLRVGGRNDLFAVGDVAATSGPKGAMNARVQIPVIAANLAAGGPAKTFAATGPRIALVPLGEHGGVVSFGFGSGGGLLLGARAASALKGKRLMTPMMNKSLGNA